MKKSVYKNAKLDIFEKAVAGEITESQRDELLTMLEEKKEASELTPDAIEDFFDELENMYPDLKDDIKKLTKKIESSSEDEDAGKEDDEEDNKEDDKEMSEAAQDLLELIRNLK